MAASTSDYFNKYSNGSQPLPTTLSAQKLSGASTASLTAATGWDTTTGKYVRMYQTTTSGGQTIPDQSTLAYYKATLSGTTLSNLTLVWSASGSDPTYPAGATVDLSVSAGYTDALATGLLVSHDQDGTLKAGAVDGAGVLASNVVTYPKLESDLQGGWNSTSALPAITAVSANGNRSYTLTHASSVASQVSPGMRRRFTRTVAAPNTAFSLDGSNDYYNKTSPNGMTFTDDFVVSAWVYLTSYPSTDAPIASRINGTQGWWMGVNSSGQLILSGHNGALANYRRVTSYQSVPLNKWVHVALQEDMSTNTATTTTCYVMIDGKDVPAYVTSAGSNPTALVQAGNLEIGTGNAGSGFTYFPGYLDQVAIYSAKVTQATILASMHQKLTGSETSLISAYSNGSVTDLNANANNLSAQNGATTATKSPFGNNGVSTTLEYGLTMSVSSDGLTEVVQVPEGCAIPTTGGVSASAYSTMANPFGFVSDKGRWTVESIIRADINTTVTVSGTWVASTANVTIPTGSWKYGLRGNFAQATTGAASIRSGWALLANATPTNGTAGTIDGGKDWPIIRILQADGSAVTVHHYAESYCYTSLSSASTYTVYGASDSITATEQMQIRAAQGAVRLYAEPTGL